MDTSKPTSDASGWQRLIRAPGDGPGVASIVMLCAVLALVAASIWLWSSIAPPQNEADEVLSEREARLLVLFALAGALGGVMRSFAYLLAFRNLSARERGQWQSEAVIGPIVGAVAGMLAFMLVQATLVEDPRMVNSGAQYLLSLACGAFALSLLGKVVERGVLRGSLSRSGILGGETSPTVPVLDRLERILEQRVSDLTVVNYDGYVRVATKRLPATGWQLDVVFDKREPSPDPHSDSHVSVGRIQVAGGVDHDHVTFTLSVISGRYTSSPLMLTVTAPTHDESSPATIVLQDVGSLHQEPDTSPGAPSDPVVVLEIAQGTQTVQVMPVELADKPDGSGSAPQAIEA